MIMKIKHKVCLNNTRQGILIHADLPNNVFSDEFTDFYFFDSDFVTSDAFVDFFNCLLLKEGAECGCLCDVSKIGTASEAGQCVPVPVDMRARDYRQIISRQRENLEGWAVDLGRVAASSDIGSWCLYCDLMAEIGIVAFKSAEFAQKVASELKAHNMAPIEEALDQQIGYAYSEALLPLWRSNLLKFYGRRTLQ